jgi:hypothetical protein
MTRSKRARHTPRTEATAQSDRATLAAVYQLVLESYERKKAAGKVGTDEEKGVTCPDGERVLFGEARIQPAVRGEQRNREDTK